MVYLLSISQHQSVVSIPQLPLQLVQF